MYEYISGKIATVTPANAVIDCGGVGYLLEITLNTYSAIQEKEEARLWVHEVVREDAYLLY
jgi:Holliday junction DNA helicase RuvA